MKTNLSPVALNAATLMPVPFPQELALYRDGGFPQIELWLDKIRRWLETERQTPADARREIERHGLQIVGACPAAVHLNGDAPAWEEQQRGLARTLDLTAQLGAPALALIALGPRTTADRDWPALVERCGWVADQAATRGLRISFEFLARIGPVNCLSTAIQLVREVNRPNFGLLLDLYHYHLSESRLEDLDRLPPGKLFLVHLDDALPRPIEWLTHDDRTFPGEGVLPWRKLAAQIQARTGFTGPWSVELYSEWVWKLPPEEVTRRVRRGLDSADGTAEK
jgi:2-keto-myo-inositol isomerase